MAALSMVVRITNRMGLILAGGSVGGGDPAPTSSEPYDLTAGGTRTIPFSYTWATEPTTSTTINVTTGSIASLQSAVSTPGALVNVPAGTYTGSLSFADNVDIVCADGAIWDMGSSQTVSSVSNVRWTGGVISGSSFAYFLGFSNCSDWLFDNVNFTDLYSLYPFYGSSGDRMQFINCSGRFFHYAFFCQGAFTGTRTNFSDGIVANCAFEAGYPGGAEATLRVQRCDGFIAVDSWLWNGAKHSLRSHYGTRNVYAHNNRMEGGSMEAHYTNGSGAATARPEDFLGAHYIYSNTYLNTAGAQNVQRGPSSPADFDGPVIIEDNTSFNTAQTIPDPGELNRRFASAVNVGDSTSNNYERPYSEWGGAAFIGGADH